MRRAVDDDDISLAGAPLDPFARSPAGQRRELEAQRVVTEPLAAQLGPGRETGLRVDVDHGEPPALPRPDDRELRRQRRLAGAAFLLRDGDNPGRHATPPCESRALPTSCPYGRK